jgi:hypothetical protein
MGGERGVVKKLAYVAYLGVGTLLGAEATLRVFVDSDPAYYVAFSNPEPGAVVRYPYGEIRYNADGFADDDFDAVKSRPRVGYVGDSVCFGVGAGHGHRISELMEGAYPGYEHMNFTGGLGGGTLQVRERALRYGERYDLDAVVYLMNLNDILPDGRNNDLNDLQERGLFRMIEWFRGRSYLYTYVRQILKDLRNPGGGPPSYEMFPEEHRGVLLATAERVSAIQRDLEPMGIRLVVLILPYEMQISEEAARVYAEAGTVWEPAFLEGATQAVLREELAGLVVVDGLEAFLGPDLDPSRRADLGVGEAFVYNKGERLDWNHPNRLGHRLLADQLAGSGVLDGLD